MIAGGEIIALHLIPGDRIRYAGRDLIVQYVSIPADGPITVRATNIRGAAPQEMQFGREEIVNWRRA